MRSLHFRTAQFDEFARRSPANTIQQEPGVEDSVYRAVPAALQCRCLSVGKLTGAGTFGYHSGEKHTVRC